MKFSLNETIDVVNKYVDKNKKNLVVNTDFVIGISRGGLIPAAWFATKIIKPLVAAYIDKQDNVYFDRTDWIRDKNVLIVDDICRSGKTLYKISKLIEKNNPCNIQIFTIYDVPSTRNKKYSEYLIDKLKPGRTLKEDLKLPWDFD